VSSSSGANSRRKKCLLRLFDTIARNSNVAAIVFVNNVNKSVFGGGSFGYCEVGTEKLNIIQAIVVLHRINQVL